MSKHKIYFLEVEHEDESKVRAHFPNAVIINEQLDAEQLALRCADATIICCFLYSKFDAATLDKLPNLKLLVTRTAGYDHIDISACGERGVVVCRVPDYGAHVIAEHAFAILLAAVRHVVAGEEQTQNLHFDWHGLRGMALRGKTLGLIGTGKIGAQVARIASLGFLMRVIAYDPFPNHDLALENHFTFVDSKEKLLAQSDVVSLHCPLLDSTKHIIDAAALAQMKTGAVLINTARGGLIETMALVAALRNHKLQVAALDVLECEQDEVCNREIMTMPNALITPHIAFYADDSVTRMYAESCATITRWLHGDKLIHSVPMA